MDRHRNEFLDAGDWEDSGSEELNVEEESRAQRFSRPAKRRKLSLSPSEASEGSNNEGSRLPDSAATNEEGHGKDDKNRSAAKADPTVYPSLSKTKPLSKAELEAADRKVRKTGVLYLSRVPPFMKPSVVRNLLSPYGNILRIFLAPEEHSSYLRRRRAGGNSKRGFVDGWIEFASKRRAKACAETLNGSTIGGKKGGYYRDDVWNLKYLKGFKWDDLMEQVQGERRAREARLRAEIARETRERKAFLGNLERAKRERGMKEKRRKKSGGAANDDVDSMSTSREMIFQQHKAKGQRQAVDEGQADCDLQRVLSKIF